MRETVCLYCQAAVNVGALITQVIGHLVGNNPTPSHGQGLHRDPDSCWVALHHNSAAPSSCSILLGCDSDDVQTA